MKKQPASRNQLKLWRKLLTGKYRSREGLFIAEGVRCVSQIVENGLIEVTAILADETVADSEISVFANLPVYTLSPSDFASVTDTENPQGIAAVCRIPAETTVDKIGGKTGIVAAFDAIQDPGNLGTMIRTASWFGVNSLIYGTGTVDPFHPKVVRSTAGATGSIPFLKGNLNELLTEFESHGFPVYLLDGSDSSVSLKSINPEEKCIIVVGNEANGIDPEHFRETRIAVRIEGKPGHVESLNAAVALSIALWHFSGQG
jgi:RNA methyltransferase, TrmH family